MTQQPYTVLIVDDEAPLRRVLERLLSRQGYRVVSAGSAETAYELLATAQANALLLDIQLPTMSGMALYLAIIHRWPALEGSIAIMTGDADALEPARPRVARGRDPRRLGDHADQRGRQGTTERAHDPVLRDEGPREPARRAGNGRYLFVSPLPATSLDQAASDGRRNARCDHQGHAGPDGRRAGAAGGPDARGIAARARPPAAAHQGRGAARAVRAGARRLDRERRSDAPGRCV